MKGHFPIDAAARGALRVWKARAESRRARLDKTLTCNLSLQMEISNFAVKRGTGQRRAFEKIRKALALASLQTVAFNPPAGPLAVWAYVKPREPVNFAPNSPSEAQSGATVDYIFIGETGEYFNVGKGLWTIEATDHALGRLLQRSPGADLDAVLLDAHHRLLAVPVADVSGLDEFFLPAGNGVFASQLRSGPDVSTGEESIHARCSTWLHADQLQDSQLPVATGGAGQHLGDVLLKPTPLRRLSSDGKGGITGFARVLDGAVSIAAPVGLA